MDKTTGFAAALLLVTAGCGSAAVERTPEVGAGPAAGDGAMSPDGGVGLGDVGVDGGPVVDTGIDGGRAEDAGPGEPDAVALTIEGLEIVGVQARSASLRFSTSWAAPALVSAFIDPDRPGAPAVATATSPEGVDHTIELVGLWASARYRIEVAAGGAVATTSTRTRDPEWPTGGCEAIGPLRPRPVGDRRGGGGADDTTETRKPSCGDRAR